MIPARLGSERLPRKPLIELHGRPLIEWVWRRVSGLGLFDACVIATDAAEIADVCRRMGADVEMTSAAHESGTERIAEVVGRERWSRYDTIVNVQGDEPLIGEVEVGTAIAQVEQGRDIGTAATPVRTLSAWRDPSVVKVTRRSNGAALYFSRSPIPHVRDRDPTAAELASELFLRHIGVYAYTRAALLHWVSLPKSALEQAERLEQLRPLEAGLTIGVGVVEQAEGGVDTPADVSRVAARLVERMETEPTRDARR